MIELRHAIIGCGRIAPYHVDAFKHVPGVRLAYAVDPVPGRAQAFAEEHDIEQSALSFEDVLADPDLTSVSLCTPHHLHAPQAMAAIAAGKHVLIEKPYVIRPEEAGVVASAAAEKGIVTLPVAQHRFDPLIISISEMLASGVLGRIALVRGHLECLRPEAYYAESDWRGNWQTEGGSVLINQAYHVLELIRWMVGPVAALDAKMDTFRMPEAMETEDTLIANLRFDVGALGVLSVTGAGGSEWRSHIELIGTEGDIAFDINTPNNLHRFQLKSKRAMRDWRKRFKADMEADMASMGSGGYYGVTHRQQAEAFSAAIRGEATGSTMASLDQASEISTLINRIYQAARQGSAE